MSYADEVKKLVDAGKAEGLEKERQRERQKLQLALKEQELSKKINDAFAKVKAAIKPFEDNGAKAKLQVIVGTFSECRTLEIQAGTLYISYTIAISSDKTTISFKNQLGNPRPPSIEIPLDELTVEKVEKILLPAV